MEIQEEISVVKTELEGLQPELNKIQLKGVRLAVSYINFQKSADEAKQQLIDEQPTEVELATTYTRLRRRLMELERQLHRQSPPWFTTCHQISLHNFSRTLETMLPEDRSRLLEALQIR